MNLFLYFDYKLLYFDYKFIREIKIGCAQPIFIKQFICVDMEAKD